MIMPDWAYQVGSIAISVSVTSGIVAKIAEKYFTSRIDARVTERIEAYKAELTKEIEEFRAGLNYEAELVRNSLSRSAADYSLYAAKRHEAIADMMSAFVTAEANLRNTFDEVGYIRDSTPPAGNRGVVRAAWRDVSAGRNRNLIYITQELDDMAFAALDRIEALEHAFDADISARNAALVAVHDSFADLMLAARKEVALSRIDADRLRVAVVKQ